MSTPADPHPRSRRGSGGAGQIAPLARTAAITA